MALLGMVVAVAVVVPIVPGGYTWVGRPFPGFFVTANGLVSYVGLQSWTGRGSLPLVARVVAVDGHPVSTNTEVYRYVRSRPVSTPIAYTFDGSGTPFTRLIPTMWFGSRDYWLTAGLLTVYGIASILMGIAVALVHPHGCGVRAFFLQELFLGFWALTGTALWNPELETVSRLFFLFNGLFPAGFIHLGLTFPVTREFVQRRPEWLLAPYAFGALLGAWAYRSFHETTPDLTPLYVSYLWQTLAFIIAIGLVAFAYRKSRDRLVRQQVRIVSLGLLIFAPLWVVGLFDDMRSGVLLASMNLMGLATLVFYASIAYALVQRRAFDIATAVRRTTLYLTLTALITGIYVLAVALLGLTIPSEVIGAAPIGQLAFVVGVAFLFQPLRSGVQHVLDRTFFRSRPDYRTIVGDMSAALPALLDLNQILARVESTVRTGFQVKFLSIALWLEDGTHLWECDTEGRFRERIGPAFHALRRLLAHAPVRKWLPLDGGISGDDPGPPMADEELARVEMADRDAALLLPITAGERLLGVFICGPRISSTPFGSHDVELLATVAAQSSIAIQNALSYRQVEEARNRLEDRVRERTAELEESTVELARSKADLESALQDLRAAQLQVLQTEKLASLGQLVAGVAHEINNPITFIVGNIRPMEEELAVVRDRAKHHMDAELEVAMERLDGMVGLIREGAERTARIVEDLRTFSRVGGAVPQPTNLHEGIEVTLRLLRPKWGARIEMHRDYGPLPHVQAVPGQINQVLMNLIANACDAIADRGNIWIATRYEGDKVRVSIRDDGGGIAPQDMGRIFDPFFTTKPQGQGTGLGLAIAYGIVEAHGGHVDVQSEIGLGTTVTVLLPVRGSNA